MEQYKHILLFDYFGIKEEIEVDNFFTLSVRYFNKNSSRDLVKQSERTVVPLDVTEIHLVEKKGEDRMIYKMNGKLYDFTRELSFLSIQNNNFSLKKLFYAIRDNCGGMTTVINLGDVCSDYDNVVF